ncbi:lasso peptide biosynthesis B2 protein [Nocardiopsis halotolerans]|uniref:lasso peptide biosynthesis B2 protein n=1 Tax=Nocardiopsis halotolerans TaxID=124252 RepID=UPI0005945DB2|nr:lasso peptide biosynthesis B2 protein [Nocardiopsis halotolerans]
MTGFLALSPRVRACDLGSATVLVHYGTGAVQILSPRAGKWWDLAGQDTALAQLLRRSGMVEVSAKPRIGSPPISGRRWEASWGVQELPMGFDAFPRVPFARMVVAFGTLLAVIAVARSGRRRSRMHRMVRLVRFTSRFGRRPATVVEASEAVHAVRALGLFSPVRVACLEESVAATLALAVLGRGVRWCHGVITDPIRLHAWIEAEGHPVAEPDSTRRCTALLTIPTVEETT